MVHESDAWPVISEDSELRRSAGHESSVSSGKSDNQLFLHLYVSMHTPSRSSGVMIIAKCIKQGVHMYFFVSCGAVSC